ncbi:MAG TPA: TonB family protein [Gemmatimonadaceae bacterium]
MLHPFVSSHQADVAPEHLGGASLSVVVHAAVIVAAIAATSVSHVTSGASAREIGAPPTNHLRFVRVTPVAALVRAARAAAAPHGATARDVTLEVPKLPNLAPIAIGKIVNAVAPELDLAQQTADWAGRQLASQAASNNVITDVLRRLYAPSADHPNAVYTPDVVEKIASPRGDNPRPRYPLAMLSAGVEASVQVRFVVDSTGRVDDKTLSFPATAQRMFVDAIKYALRHSRYFPAEFAGRHVAQLVSQQFVFRIEK